MRRTLNGLIFATFVFVILVVLFSFGCRLPLSTSTRDISPYWPKAERLVLFWLSFHPSCPPDYVNPLGRVSVMRAKLPDDEPCYYDPGRDQIVYDHQWFTGCIEHELGHAALELVGNPCWRDFGHDWRTCCAS